ncbi:dephospho-CoA kinase [Ekhidna sp.]|uniref:dephospho-CoA kinase n=1 Tax=Ekhidna sp. TaxID=2608089 RepID=UPI003CCB9A1F
MPNKQLFIGITGGIGSGKTTVCRVFEVLGAKTYYADDRAKMLMHSDEKLVSQIKELFGEEAYVDGKLDRKYIAEKVFKDDALLEKLNGLVHPAVGMDVEQWRNENPDADLLLKEAALLFETGSYKALDKNILVTAPEEVRIERVVSRDKHRNRSDVKAIIDKQMSDEEKRPLADYVVNNDGSESIIKQVMKIYQELVVT